VVIRDTPGVFVLKKKAPAKADKSKDEGNKTILGVLDVPKNQHESENESWGDNEDDIDDNSDDDSKGNDDKADNDDDGNSDADDNENMYAEEDDDLYKDVDLRSLGVEQDKEMKGDEEMTDVDQNVSQENKFLILENVPPAVDEVTSMMNVKNRQEESSTQAPSLFTMPETTIPATLDEQATTVPPTISMMNPLPQLTTPSPAPKTVPTITSIPALLDFSSLFRFDQRVPILETNLQKSIASDSTKEVSNFAILVIQSTINESFENVFLAKYSSQLKLTYEEAESLTKFELKKILLDKIERSESYKMTPEHKELYEGLVKSYNLDKDLFSSYGKAYYLKRDHEDKDKNEDPSAGSYRGLKIARTLNHQKAQNQKNIRQAHPKAPSLTATKRQP
nr:hypothetical protein [Tanacetum cinerariifolium]